MNVIIPIGNLDEEFQSYLFPKPLVYVRGKHMVYWVLDSLKPNKDDHIFILYTSDLDIYHFRDTVHKYNKNIKCIPIPYQTKNVIETITYGLKYIPPERCDCKTLFIDSDNFYKDILDIARNTKDNTCFYKLDTHPKVIYSYILIDKDEQLLDISEKNKISDYANIGVYSFKDIDTIKKFIKPSQNYISDIYKEMITNGMIIYTKRFDEVVSMGRQLDINLFSLKNLCRFCFDLDNTLVSYPVIENDYTSVKPIDKNISFLRYLKYLGHTIIIYTARRMRTHKGNSGKVLADIGKITFDTLEIFNIPFDEIYFGKPEADFYIDDKAINCFSNLEIETGFHNISIPSRLFNEVKVVNDTIVKKSSNDKIKGEIYWYKNCPESIKHLFPKFISNNEDSYVIEKINGVSLSYLFTQKRIDNRLFDKVMNTLDKIHSSSSDTVFNGDIYDLYKKKLIERFKHPIYSTLERSEEIFHFLCECYDNYKYYNKAQKGIIHGDTVFSNILLDDKGNLFFIDMRGVINDELTLYGDKNYDYAKLYQSLSGYDFILKNQTIPIKYTQQLLNKMSCCFSSDIIRWRWIKVLGLGLYFTLLPLHDENTIRRMYEHILNIYDMMI